MISDSECRHLNGLDLVKVAPSDNGIGAVYQHWGPDVWFICNRTSELLTAKDLEALLKIDQKTIYRYVACGLIPYVRIQSNIRFIKWQIVKWIDEQTFLPKSFDKT